MILIITWEFLEERLQLSPEQQVPLHSTRVGDAFLRISQYALKFSQVDSTKHDFATTFFPPAS